MNKKIYYDMDDNVLLLYEQKYDTTVMNNTKITNLKKKVRKKI